MAPNLRRTLDLLPALASTLDAELRYEVMNAQHRTWLGIDPDAAIGRTIWAVLGETLRPLLEPGVTRALAGETVDLELELPKPISPRWVRATITPEVDADGAVVRIHFLVTDLGRERVLHRKLERSEAVFNAAFTASGVGKALVDDHGSIREVNPAFAAMLGFSTAQLAGRHFAEITHPDDIDADLMQFGALKRGEIDGYRMEKRYIGADGAAVDALLTVAVVRATARAAQFFVAQVVDVRDRKQAEQGVRERNAHLALALEMVDGGIWQYDLAAETVQFSPAFARMMGLPGETPVALADAVALIHPDDRAAAGSHGSGLVPDVARATSVFRMKSIDGDWRWLRLRRQLMHDARGVPTSVLGVVFDITGEREREAQLTQEAITDPLTGLLNRRGFDTALVRAMPRLRTTKPALLMIDLDGFKPINDAHGHAMGDKVLRDMGQRLRAAVRAGDVVARLGGDEFAVLLPDVDRPAAEAAAQRIVAALAEPWLRGRVEARTGASVGVALASSWDDRCTMMKRADAALYAVKRAGRGAWKLAA